MSRRKRQQGSSTPPTNLSAFRDEERRWKSRLSPPDLSLAFDADNIVWNAEPVQDRLRGVWTSGNGQAVECWRVELHQLAGTAMGQSRWKGKDRQREGDYAIIVPRIPGFVFFPRILPESLQRALVVETLRHAGKPNLTSLDNHYELPSTGLWTAWCNGRGEAEVSKKAPLESSATTAYEKDPPQSQGRPMVSQEAEAAAVAGATVSELLPKLRWANVGWHYNWTTKLYEFERGQPPLPPLIYRCCRALARRTPWAIFYGSDGIQPESMPAPISLDWQRWKDAYEPDAGIVNFYHLKDSLTSHVDLSEVDAVSPLVSLSLGHSSIFLIGGATRDIPPLPVLLRSGDGLIMSGAGRRAYHALPRVLEETLPDHLRADCADPEELEGEDWRLYGEYLERGARINVNVRSVF
ncbi:hypothetical protein JCM10908_005307 [Rhodotorula pacifica]|uniref:uncharacterized protein n=1 Tax=Rhodotorula pacifica TaxID=1495444 RepID=UPI003180FBB1